MKHQDKTFRKGTNRRSFLTKGAFAAGAATLGSSVFGRALPAFAEEKSGHLPPGDAAIVRFLAAAEIIETDLWQQYAELGGITSGKPNTYQKAFAKLDGDGS